MTVRLWFKSKDELTVEFDFDSERVGCHIHRGSMETEQVTKLLDETFKSGLEKTTAMFEEIKQVVCYWQEGINE